MIYRCRFKVPNTSDWFDVEAISPEQAANEFHSRYVPNQFASGNTRSLVYVVDHEPHVHFALIEVENQGELISRVFYSEIHRRGAKAMRLTIAEIAKRLGWTHPIDQLLESGWQGEDTEWQ